MKKESEKRLACILVIITLIIGTINIVQIISDMKNKDVVGTWRLESINDKSLHDYYKTAAEQNGYNLDDFLARLGTTEDNLPNMTVITINEDKTATIRNFGEEAVNYTYAMDDDDIVLTLQDSDNAIRLTYQNDKLLWTQQADDNSTDQLVFSK